MILFRQRYPRWWFDWNLELQRLATRVPTYLALMDDKHPSTDDRQSVRLDYPYPDAARDLNRWPPLVNWLPTIPYYIMLFFLEIAALDPTPPSPFRHPPIRESHGACADGGHENLNVR